MVCFEYLDKSLFDSLSREIFTILADNMDGIAPTGCTREADYECWFSAVSEGLTKSARQMVLIRECAGGRLIGFFQYYANVNTGIFMMEEAQIVPEFWGVGGIFRALYTFVLSSLPSGIKYVEAYANKNNARSIGILGHLGLSAVGENKSGTSFHFRGDFERLCEWLYGKKDTHSTFSPSDIYAVILPLLEGRLKKEGFSRSGDIFYSYYRGRESISAIKLFKSLQNYSGLCRFTFVFGQISIFDITDSYPEKMSLSLLRNHIHHPNFRRVSNLRGSDDWYCISDNNCDMPNINKYYEEIILPDIERVIEILNKEQQTEL